MYWTDWGVPAKIERASMDGSLRETLHNTDLHHPNDITIDYQSQTIYWVDASLHKIESSHVDGSNRRTLWHDNLPKPFSMTYYNGVLYWSDWTLNSVLYIPVSNASTANNLVSSLVKDPMGVRVIAMDAQPTSKFSTKVFLQRMYCALEFSSSLLSYSNKDIGVPKNDDNISLPTY